MAFKKGKKKREHPNENQLSDQLVVDALEKQVHHEEKGDLSTSTQQTKSDGQKGQEASISPTQVVEGQLFPTDLLSSKAYDFLVAQGGVDEADKEATGNHGPGLDHGPAIVVASEASGLALTTMMTVVGYISNEIRRLGRAMTDLVPTGISINPISDNNTVNALAKASGVAITGTSTAEDNQVVTVHWGTASHTATVASGTWSATFATGEIPTAQGVASVTADVSDLAGNPATQATKAVTIDTLAPTVSSVALSATGGQNNLLNAGDVVTATVVFSESVIVVGNPTIGLTIDTSTANATYASGSGTGTLAFTYTITAGDTDANGISVAANAITLSGSQSIKDTAGNSATLNHVAVTDQSTLLVDTTAPLVNSVTFSPTSSVVTLQFDSDLDLQSFSFSPDPVAVFNSNLVWNTSSSLNGPYTALQAPFDGYSIHEKSIRLSSSLQNLSTYPYMQISYLHSSGDQASNVVQDLAGNDLAGFSNRQVTIDTTSRPYITLESNPSASGAVHGYLNLGDTVDLVFDFSENVTFTGQLGVGLNIGGALKSANYLSGNGTDTLTFRYTISSGDTDEQGISIKADPFTGSVKNASGVDADLWFDSVAVDYVDALSNSHAYLVDTTPPVIGNTPASNSPIHANTSVALSPLSFSDSGGSDKTLNLSMVLTNLTSTGLTDLDATTPGIQLSDTGDGLAARLANARFTATSSAANAKIAFTLTDPAGNASTYTYDFGTVL